MSEKVEHVHSHSTNPHRSSLKIKVERGRRGGYGFEVSLAGADEVAMIAQIATIYAKLDAEFAPERRRRWRQVFR